jgi:hypothetical protein
MSLTKRLIEQQDTDAKMPDKHLQSAQRDVRFVLRGMAAIENISEIDFETFARWTEALSDAAFDLELAMTPETEDESVYC